MASTTHMATVEDDRRHLPGPNALPLWSESYWFPIYDPEQRDRRRAARRHAHRSAATRISTSSSPTRAPSSTAVAEQRAAPPPLEGDSLTRRRACASTSSGRSNASACATEHGRPPSTSPGKAIEPGLQVPAPPPSGEFPGHIEQGGRVTGTVTLGGRAHPVRRPRPPRPLAGAASATGRSSGAGPTCRGEIGARLLVQRGPHHLRRAGRRSASAACGTAASCSLLQQLEIETADVEGGVAPDRRRRAR